MSNDTYDYQSEWDDFDTQDFGSLGNTDPYQGMANDYNSYQPVQPEQAQMPSYDFQGEMNNFGSGDFNQLGNTSQWGNADNTGYMGGQFAQLPQQQANPSWGGMLDKGLGALNGVFGGRSSGSTAQNLGALLAGYMADQRNKKTGAQAQQMIQQQSRPYDKVGTTGATMMGGSSMRDAAQIQQALAQQRLDKFRQDPTSDAGYKSQMDQILEAKRRVAAARGVRFNPEAEQGALGPGTLAALAQNQMNYDKNYQTDRNSYFQPAGAGMTGGLAEMLAAMQQQSKGDYYSGLAGGAGFTSANGATDPEYLTRLIALQQGQK